MNLIELQALKDKKYAAAEARNPLITCNANMLEDGDKRRLSYVISLIGIRANQVGLLK